MKWLTNILRRLPLVRLACAANAAEKGAHESCEKSRIEAGVHLERAKGEMVKAQEILDRPLVANGTP